MDPLNIPAQFEIRSFSRSSDNRGGGTLNISSVPIDMPTIPFTQLFSRAIIRIDTVIVLTKFEVRSFTHSQDNSDWSFGVGCEPPILGKERP